MASMVTLECMETHQRQTMYTVDARELLQAQGDKGTWRVAPEDRPRMEPRLEEKPTGLQLEAFRRPEAEAALKQDEAKLSAAAHATAKAEEARAPAVTHSARGDASSAKR